MKEHFISTYTKIIASQYKPLKTFIEDHIHTVPSKLEQSPTIALLSEKQIDEALNGPFGQYIQTAMATYAALSQLASALNLTQDAFFKTQRIDASQKVILPQELKNFPPAQLTSIQKQINELVNKHHKEWITQVSEWQTSLLSALQQANIMLSDIEQKDFISDETISELLKQFTEFHLPMPKIALNPISFKDYFVLKTYLAIHNSLARQQLPHTKENVDPTLKQLKNIYVEIEKQGKEKLKSQKEELDKTVEGIKF